MHICDVHSWTTATRKRQMTECLLVAGKASGAPDSLNTLNGEESNQKDFQRFAEVVFWKKSVQRTKIFSH